MMETSYKYPWYSQGEVLSHGRGPEATNLVEQIEYDACSAVSPSCCPKHFHIYIGMATLCLVLPLLLTFYATASLMMILNRVKSFA